MHSIGYLVNELESKHDYIKNVLVAENNYQSQLENNIEDIKNDIQTSIEKQVERLKARSQQLMDAADALYKIKQVAVSKRIALLDRSSKELKECLRIFQTEEKETIQRQIIKNTLNKIDYPTTELVDGGLLTWRCDDFQIEEVIREFGMIDVKNQFEEESENDFELVSPKQPTASRNLLGEEELIEMEVKSIEMYHLTSQSAINEEKKDLDKIEVEMEDLALLDKKRRNENFLFIERTPTEAKKSSKVINVDGLSQWLHKVSEQSLVAEEKVNVNKKVESWLDTLGNSNEICALNAVPRLFDSSQWLAESANATSVSTVENRKSEKITKTTDSNVINEWLISTKEAKLSENKPLSNDWDSWLSSSFSSRTVESENNSDLQPRHDITLEHLRNLSNQPGSSYLRVTEPKEVKGSKQFCESTSITLNHMKNILNQPTNSFLLKPTLKKTESIDKSLCDWLIGNAQEKCEDCIEQCAFEKDNSNWIKVATDW